MNELNLIVKAQSGITSCFSQLVSLYQARLYHYLLARCQSSYDAEDVLQETFISAYKYLNSYKPKWQFSTWLFTIANRLIKKQHKLYYYNSQTIIIEATDEIDSTSIDRNNVWIQVKNILNSESYDVLWFSYIEQLNIKEIAHIIKRSQSWVKISLFRSKKKLAKNKNIKTLLNDFLLQGLLL